MLPHRLAEFRVGHTQHVEAQVVPLAAAVRGLQIRPDARAVGGRIRQRGLQPEFIAHLPRPDRRGVPVARHHFTHILAHPLMDLALRIAPLVHWLAHQVGHAGVIPEKRRDEPDAMLLGRGHNGIEAPEVFLPVAAVKRHVLRPKSRRGKPHERNPLAGQHFEPLLVARVIASEQGTIETGEVIDLDGAEGLSLLAQPAVAVAREHRIRVHGGKAGSGQDGGKDIDRVIIDAARRIFTSSLKQAANATGLRAAVR